MSDEVKLGIIGVGQIGKRHLEQYRGTSRLMPLPPVPDARIIAACDINEEELERVAKEYDIPHTFTDFRELLAMDEIVAVDVCLHNNLHAPLPSLPSRRARTSTARNPWPAPLWTPSGCA